MPLRAAGDLSPNRRGVPTGRGEGGQALCPVPIMDVGGLLTLVDHASAVFNR